MLRWVETLVDWDLTERCSDPHDKRTTRLALTASGYSKMKSYIDLIRKLDQFDL
ncbi:hypothetical protein [Sphingomonas ginsengisoli (ex An et al. 2013)]